MERSRFRGRLLKGQIFSHLPLLTLVYNSITFLPGATIPVNITKSQSPPTNNPLSQELLSEDMPRIVVCPSCPTRPYAYEQDRAQYCPGCHTLMSPYGMIGMPYQANLRPLNLYERSHGQHPGGYSLRPRPKPRLPYPYR